MYFAKITSAVLLVALMGCTQSGPQIAPVHGRVTLDGQPLKYAGVVFRSPGKNPSGGTTDENGNYELIYKLGVKGAPVGMNQVSILQDTRRVPGPQRVPARYNEKSELQHEVKPGDNEINFPLTTDEK
ncbi:MAG TPA: carboxypeptidase regulatory-like domain-containing protein [Lacipirellulaceae bacterium]|nr:carboxypeptidase regulatory-like domain-containing protein [Lacipirellulaceae bacterium]